LAALLLATTAYAFLFQSVTVADALSRANAWIKNNPNRAEGYFFLGGINASAWAKGTTGKEAEVEVASFGGANDPPMFVPWNSIMFPRNAGLEITPEVLKYLGDSITAYRKAVELDPNNPRYHLGLAWSLEQAAHANMKPDASIGGAQPELTADERKQCASAIVLLGNEDHAQREQASKTLAALMPRDAELLLAVKTDDPEVTARIASLVQVYKLAQEAVEQYRQAYQQGVDGDLKADRYDAEADNTVSVKAGERLLLLLRKLPAPAHDEIKKIEQSLQVIKAKPQTAHFYG
jgi:tetratricopeptide (TPR) repeat protein